MFPSTSAGSSQPPSSTDPSLSPMPSSSVPRLTLSGEYKEVEVLLVSMCVMVAHFVSGPPTLPQLLRLKIPQRVGEHYLKFGITLLNDRVGSRVQAFKMECLGDSEKIVIRILREWLVVGKLESLTWETLVKALRDSDLSDLANDLIHTLTHGLPQDSS